MCGRYGLYETSDDVDLDAFVKDNRGYIFAPNYNVAPTQIMPVITGTDGRRAVESMQWGINRKLGPDIEKDIFNTRAEKAFDSFWRTTVKSRRCLVPANGFYEWEKTHEGRQPYWISLPGTTLLYFAGIYDEDQAGNRHYSIMTTSANHEMERVHNRMPVILREDEREAWLFASSDEAEALSEH